jgi:mono/diheme cytochrome c family protein
MGTIMIRWLVVCGVAWTGFALPLRGADGPGASAFRSNCVICHAADASGKTAMGKKFNIRDLRSPEVQKQTDAELAEIISKGKKPMPAFSGRLNERQIQEVVTYLRELGKKQ